MNRIFRNRVETAIAISIFAAAYLAVLGIIVVPKGYFVKSPGQEAPLAAANLP